MTSKKWLLAASLTLCVMSPSLVHAQPAPPAPEAPSAVAQYSNSHKHFMIFSNKLVFNSTVNMLVEGFGIPEAHITVASGSVALGGITYPTLDFSGCTAFTSVNDGMATFTLSHPDKIQFFAKWIKNLSAADTADYNNRFRIQYKADTGNMVQVKFNDFGAIPTTTSSIEITGFAFQA